MARGALRAARFWILQRRGVAESHSSRTSVNPKSKIGMQDTPVTNIQQESSQRESVDEHLGDLRSRISDLGSELDQTRAGIAAAMGAGAFFILLAAGAAYDLLKGNAGVWGDIGIPPEILQWGALILGAAGVRLLVGGITSRRRGDPARETELADLEQQYADLLEHKKSMDSAAQNGGR